ncbi:hypothetical protein Micbo1qcDRAFT_162501 [Microdochium bolleyi]|uniref:Zn(2)-C6 fungal-type domain-containing protein n=1 Tax=Microdochium bolleyi TaxID=196109 RepID=A0A136J5C8_9PEZI|nr:hypothetical protein Micbo1qcDRAFT_162501 [Microdochium bolleyi]
MDAAHSTSDEIINSDELDRAQDGEEGGDTSGKKAAVKKRTKTGCLTCRQRRIKCDESRPICNNCIKSKRQCEGYNKRVKFTEPLGPFVGMPMGPLQYIGRPPQVIHRDQHFAAAQQRLATQPLLAPKPPQDNAFHPLDVQPHLQMYHGAGGASVSGPAGYNGAGPGLPYAQDPTGVPIFIPDTMRMYPQDQSTDPTAGEIHAQAHLQDTLPEQTSRRTPENPAQPLESHVSHNDFLAGYKASHAGFEQPQEWDFEDYRQDESMDESDDEASAAASMMQLRGPKAGSFVSYMLKNPHDPHGTLPRYFMASHTSMATYDPEPSQSPLNDEHIRAIFSHFIRVTGPAISLYERHSVEPGSFTEGQQLPRSQRHIWSSTFPILSFRHPALLQAILAMASLQIARLERNQPTASLKHYHLALRRIARNVGRPARRAQPANLAATLLLAYWEVWNSDHEKWCKHLLGARWIMKDIPFLSMSKSVLQRRLRERQMREQMRAQAQLNGYTDFVDDSDPVYLHRDWELIDHSLLSVISGRPVSYVDQGFTAEGQAFFTLPKQPVTDKDIETYENLSDMYWWYCKMDTYQSILGGQKLFMDYDKWLACPPRSPIGRLDALYGTYDHLMLLLARVSNYNANDQARKKAALSRSAHGPKAPPPGTFPGLVPTSGNVPLPAGFSPQREATPEVEEPRTDADFEAQTAAAHEEWGRIRHAFEVFKKYLGPDFAPLDADVYPPLSTPFGPSRHYRTYSVAGIWLNYYMGLIMLYRAHPTMPPIAMMAAGLQAPNTAMWAMEIGRIAIGLEEDTTHTTVVSTLSAAGLIESAFPLFVAAVQYREEPQRHWLIRRLHDISRLTGWESARQIAMGCETAWIRAYELKRGPMYVREPDMDLVSIRDLSEVRRLDARIDEIKTETGRITKEQTPHYAMGLLLVERDFEKLELQDN